MSLDIAQKSALLAGVTSLVPAVALTAGFPALGLAPSSIAVPMLSISAAFFAFASAYQLRRMRGPRGAAPIDPGLENQVLNAHAMVTMTDAEANLTYVNDRFLEASGYEREDLIGKNMAVLFADLETPVVQSIKESIFVGKTWSGETILLCADGSQIWTQTTIMPRLDKAGRLLGWMSVRTDITAARSAASEQDIVLSLHRMPSPIAIFCEETGAVLYLNDAALDLFGWDRSTYLGRRILEGPVGMDVPESYSAMRTLRNGEADHVTFKLVLNGRDFEAHLQLVRPEAARARYVVSLRDLSEMEELERVKDEFISNVSHELRSPLTSIKGGMGLVLSGIAGEIPEKAKGLIDIAHRNTDRLILLVNDILDMEKIAAGRMEFDLQPADLAKTVEQGLAEMEGLAQQYEVSFAPMLPNQPAIVDFDQTRMMQVLANLVSNAAKFSAPGSEVLVSLTSVPEGWQLEVVDKGKGIPREDMATIFERFQQASNRSGKRTNGTGLGLSIVKAIVERHKGRVTIDSTEGVGTTVTCVFPRGEYKKPTDVGIQAAG
ncbi:PAS domain S-box protein [Alphaproteobacteria bacterium KMM 3653]|uniref:histidine kinase n=1 Tax=Harenicola maris TaxID=2841044 RepID=A0AAP2G3F0_9RHOB|nr:PAS domain S-box protein [Harenicola maris]